MQKVLLKKFATKMKANVSAKKDMAANDVIGKMMLVTTLVFIDIILDVRMDGLDTLTVNRASAPWKDPHPRRVSVTRTVDSVLVK